MPTPPTPSTDLVERAAALLGSVPSAWGPVAGGHTRAERWRCRLGDGTAVFLKGATDADTAAALAAEQRVYAGVRGPFLPRSLGFLAAGERSLLALEDLSQAYWPPPWREGDVEAVLEALERLHATPPPAGVPEVDEAFGAELHGWENLSRDPEPFLALGLTTAGWLTRALPTLLVAEARVGIRGRSLLHQDVRSDNLCLVEAPAGGARRALLVDWNWAVVGDARLDLAFWAPSLAQEGGPAPERLLGQEPALAAAVSGFFAARAGLPAGALPPRVREVQRRQLLHALPWAARALGLAPLDGPSALR